MEFNSGFKGLTYTRHTDKLRSGPVFENYTKYHITDA